MRPAALATLGAFVALALFWTWPLAAHFSSRVPHDPGDPILNIWLLWWNAQAVPFTARWWSPPIFHPMPGALALSEHLAGIGLVATPMQLFGATPLAAYNAALILSFALSGFFAFVLVRRLAGRGCDGASAAIAASGSWSSGAMFVLPAQPAARVAPIGEPWPATVRAPARGTLDIDLGAVRVVRTIGFAVRWRYEELAGRMAIGASLDGQAWSTVWDDWTGGPAVIAATAHPLEVPVRLTVPDISARYLRVHPAPPWLRREIEVYGPK